MEIRYTALEKATINILVLLYTSDNITPKFQIEILSFIVFICRKYRSVFVPLGMLSPIISYYGFQRGSVLKIELAMT